MLYSITYHYFHLLSLAFYNFFSFFVVNCNENIKVHSPKDISSFFCYQLEQSVIIYHVYRRLLRVFFPNTKVTKHEMVMDQTISSFSRIWVISEFQISHFQNEAKCKTFLVKMSFI